MDSTAHEWNNSFWELSTSQYGGFHKWGYPKIYMVIYIVEIPIQKWMMTRGTPIYGNHHIVTKPKASLLLVTVEASRFDHITTAWVFKFGKAQPEISHNWNRCIDCRQRLWPVERNTNLLDTGFQLFLQYVAINWMFDLQCAARIYSPIEGLVPVGSSAYSGHAYPERLLD